MIPKIIHQTAKTADIPKTWRAFQERARRLHPDWEYRLWTDDDNRTLVEERMPHLLASFLSLPLNIMRADVIRYVIMHEHGGLYFDFDYEFLKQFPYVEKDIVIPRESDDGADAFIGNSVLASRPGHPFWRAALQEFETSFAAIDHDPTEDDILFLTGPGLLTRVYLKEFGNDPDFFTPRRAQFNPPIPRTDEQYHSLVSEGTAFGIHHCHGTWRSLSIPRRLKRKIKSLLKSKS
ncbi:MAG: glycosyltransferase [Spirochaetia bacterium]|jgi:mannosyltransferase OCH1-like enzyme